MPGAIVTLDTGTGFDLGPFPIAWHGLFTALGIVVAVALALRFASERSLERERVINLALAGSVAGLIGARVFYLAERDLLALIEPERWFSSTGFSFWGAVLFAVPTVLLLYRDDVRLRYFDALASGFGLGMAVGRIGDILIGEHLGPASDLPWAFRYTNPDALAPSTELAYHPGPLYEAILGLAIFALIWPNRRRFRVPGQLALAVISLYALGRFGIFFLRSDSAELVLGLSDAQVTAAAILAACGIGALLLRREPPPPW